MRRWSSGTEVTSLRAAPEGWCVATAEGEAIFATVVLAVPAPQAARLLGDHPLVEQLDAGGNGALPDADGRLRTRPARRRFRAGRTPDGRTCVGRP